MSFYVGDGASAVSDPYLTSPGSANSSVNTATPPRAHSASAVAPPSRGVLLKASIRANSRSSPKGDRSVRGPAVPGSCLEETVQHGGLEEADAAALLDFSRVGIPQLVDDDPDLEEPPPGKAFVDLME